MFVLIHYQKCWTRWTCTDTTELSRTCVFVLSHLNRLNTRGKLCLCGVFCQIVVPSCFMSAHFVLWFFRKVGTPTTPSTKSLSWQWKILVSECSWRWAGRKGKALAVTDRESKLLLTSELSFCNCFHSHWPQSLVEGKKHVCLYVHVCYKNTLAQNF